MNDSQKISMIRQAFPVIGQCAYLNTGSTGPFSQMYHDALVATQEADLQNGRSGATQSAIINEASENIRAKYAKLAQATTDEIALTQHTTYGINIALHGLSWQPGDEIITTDTEHEGGMMPLFVLRQRQGVVLRIVDIKPDDSDAEILAKIEREITPRTRLILFSHVAWNLGIRFPMEEIAALAHQRHLLTMVDAAQSAGAIPLDLPASGVDFYAMPGQKWLCGPQGTGAFYVRRDRISQLQPTFAGYRTQSQWDYTGHFMPSPGARRYETGSLHRASNCGLSAHLSWVDEHVGWDWIYGRIAHLNQYTYDALSQTEGVSMITPSSQSGLACFVLDGFESNQVVADLAEMGVVIRSLKNPACLRVSTGYYNNEEDIDRLIAGLLEIKNG